MIRVIVPATTANLGPGFDVLGLAINLYNEFWFEELESGLKIEILDGGNDKLPLGEENLAFISAKRLFDKVNYRYKGLRITIKNDIPTGCGLGSSSTAIVGGLLAANKIASANLSKNELFQLAAEIEGHPDNVGPAMFGGFTICYSAGPSYRAVSYKPASNLKPVLLIPDTGLETRKARSVLPRDVPMNNAVFNIGRSSLLVSALLLGDAGLLSEAMKDRLHQPYRASLIPGLMEMIQRIEEATGAGVALSGAGPSLLCIIDKSSEKVFLNEIKDILSSLGANYRVQPVDFDLEGARI
ncbi:MAG: homoserine kinase [Actinomycetota bacterium]|nr:homoserine kinase [Actinomycetota bacterium]